MPDNPTRPRRRRSLAFLNQELIVDAAMAVIDADGADALTFRRLGTELGTDHTAVLRHFRSKDELLLAIADRLLADAVGAVEVSDDWRTTLADLATAIRRACGAHPGVATMVAGRTVRSDAEFRGADIVLGALRQAGLDGRDAASCYRALVDVALAYAALEATVAALPAEVADGDRAAWRRDYQALPADRYPNVAAVAEHLPAVDDEDQFSVAMGLFFDGIEARARARHDRADVSGRRPQTETAASASRTTNSVASSFISARRP
ncbi:MAG: TetR/AcrR family transcriptional regulator [Gordonia sp. (in: high G+C Gram-positive bacteria)]